MAAGEGEGAVKSAGRAPRPLTVLSAASLLCLAGLVADATQAWKGWRHYYVAAPVGRIEFSASGGRVQGQWASRISGDDAWGWGGQVWRGTAGVPDGLRMRGGGLVDMRGVGVTLQTGELYSRRFVAVTVPHWAAVLASVVLPVRWGFARRARRRLARVRDGRCPRCGYDLRATPARCPECGLVAAAAH